MEEKKAEQNMIFQDLIQIGIFIVALANLIYQGRAASMAFPFSMFNIAYPAAGYKSRTHLNNRTMDSIYNKYGFVIYNGIQE